MQNPISILRVMAAALGIASAASSFGHSQQTSAPVSDHAQSQPMAAPRITPTPFVAPDAPQMELNAAGDGFIISRARENFSQLSLMGSDLQPVPPLLGSREKKANFTRELLQVRWRPNDSIDLYVILPVGIKNPPVVLYLYGFPTDTDRFKNDAWCNRVVQGGAAAVGFVSALTGQRYEYRPFKENFISLMPEAVASTVHDVTMVLNYLGKRGDLDMNRVGMFGQGSGGAIAILAASVEPRIKALDLLDPWGDWPDWLASAPDVPRDERAECLKPEFLKAMEPLEPLTYLPQLKTQHIRIQFVEDEGEPKEAMARIQAAAPPATQVVRFKTSRKMYDENSGGRLFEWISTQLGAHPAPKQQASSVNDTAPPARSPAVARSTP